MTLTLELSSEHVEEILNALAERPLRAAIGAFLAVQKQVREQNQEEPGEFT